MLLAAVGDVMLGDSALLLGRGVRSTCARNGVDFPFACVAPALRSADVAFCNLECVLSNVGLDPHSVLSLSMRGLPDSAAGLGRAGFRVVSLANNHAMDHGRAALMDTASRLVQQGILSVGQPCGKSGPLQPLVLLVDGFALGFLAHNLVGSDSLGDRRSVISHLPAGVAAARSACDALVVSLHWGDEYMAVPAPWQVELAHRIIDAGASLVCGHHPHVLQPVERFRHGLIAYSLGNFVCDMRWGVTSHSAVLLVDLTRNGVGAVQMLPIELNRRWQPVVSLKTPKCYSFKQMLSAETRDLAMATRPSGGGSKRYLPTAIILRFRYRVHLALDVCAALARYSLVWKLQILRCLLRRPREGDPATGFQPRRCAT